MPRYRVDATVAYDAWIYIEAADDEAAKVEASHLSPSDLERGDPWDVQIESVVLDA